MANICAAFSLKLAMCCSHKRNAKYIENPLVQPKSDNIRVVIIYMYNICIANACANSPIYMCVCECWNTKLLLTRNLSSASLYIN